MSQGRLIWKSILELLVLIAKVILRRLVPKPGTVVIRLVKEDHGMLLYEAILPEMPTGTDIVRQHFTVEAEGVTEEQDLPADATTVQFRVNSDVSVTLSLTYIDDAGNVSAPSTQQFMSKDTIPPTAPGAFGQITLLSEEPDEIPMS